MKPIVAVIGFGHFGSLAARHLATYFSVVVYDKSRKVRIPRSYKRVSLREAASQKIVVLCVPVHRLQSLLRSIAPHLPSGALVVDNCAVKEEPLRWMRNILPTNVSILGTHPLFGPSSTTAGIRGHHIVLCPVRIPFRQLQVVHRSLRNVGLHVHHMSPAAHDKFVAQTLILTQFIGRSASQIEAPHTRFSTPSYELLTTISKRAVADSFYLFRDAYKYNRYAQSVMKKLMAEAARLQEKVSW